MPLRDVRRRLPLLLSFVVVAVALAWALGDRAAWRESAGFDSESKTVRAKFIGAQGEAKILAAFRERRSGVMVEAEGVVFKVLADDRDGARHQRFLVRLDGGHTLLVAHNIDLAPRVPLAEGDRVALRGQYEWNERGGVVHWTHHDPDGRRRGGWIRLAGRTYS